MLRFISSKQYLNHREHTSSKMCVDLLLYVSVTTMTLYVLYKWITLNNDYFAKRNLPHLNPNIFVGNLIGLITNRHNPMEFISTVCNKFPHAKFIGIFNFRSPMYIARDPKVIKQLTVKDFDYFENHESLIASDSDKLLGNSLFLLRGSRWRDMRATLSPAFTGNKLRLMFELVSECTENMTAYFLQEAKTKRKIEWEMKDLFSRYTIDVIASCAFGLRVNSLVDRTNEFFMTGSTMLQFRTVIASLRVLLLRLVPRIMRILNIGLFEKKVGTFFCSIVLDTMKIRARKNIIRPDMINILMQVRNGRTDYLYNQAEVSTNDLDTVEEMKISIRQMKRKWNDNELVSQCFLFFAAGFESTSTLLSFLAYELAVNPDIQARLYDEVLATSKSLGGKRLNYDSLHKLKYMDQVVSETVRKWPPALLTDRLCSRDYIFDDGNDTKFLIEKGRIIWIPISGIQRDPNYWPDPDKFDPERFNDENRKNIVPGTFLGFGSGPRNCIGSRFALMGVKTVMSNILLHFSFESTAKTQIPVKLAKSSVTIQTERGIHVEFKLRK